MPSRELALAAAFALGAATCSARPLPESENGSGGTGPGIGGAGGGTFTPTRKVDMLFVIDDSPEMPLMQRNLVNNFPRMVQKLMEPPGLPDLHLAVISTDLGADGDIDGCRSTPGKNGVFQYTGVNNPAQPCKTGLDPGATFISDIGGVKNYTGSLTDVFACIASLGENGCGFEHQLAAIPRALGADGRPAPPENLGFLRPDAFLLILILTNEDDCSAPPGSGLFDAASTDLGPLGNFRCNEFGHLCNGVRPPRAPPTGNADDVVTLDGCTSAEGAGMLIPVADIVAQIRSLKRFPDQQIFVNAIAGPPQPYAVHWMTRPRETQPRPYMVHSCTAADATFADPAVRIADWVHAFGANGLLLSACDGDWTPALDGLAAALNQPR